MIHMIEMMTSDLTPDDKILIIVIISIISITVQDKVLQFNYLSEL